MTSAVLDDHVLVLLEYDVGALVEVEDGDGRELGRSASGQRGSLWTHEMDQSLHDCVVCGVQVRVQREGALAVTVEGLVVVGSDDPVLGRRSYSVSHKHVRREEVQQMLTAVRARTNS